MSIPYVGEAVNYHSNGDGPPIEPGVISALNGTNADIVINSDSRTETDVPIKPKSGNLHLLRYYTI